MRRRRKRRRFSFREEGKGRTICSSLDFFDSLKDLQLCDPHGFVCNQGDSRRSTLSKAALEGFISFGFFLNFFGLRKVGMYKELQMGGRSTI